MPVPKWYMANYALVRRRVIWANYLALHPELQAALKIGQEAEFSMEEEVLRAIPKLDPEEKIFFCRGFECGLASLDPESGQLQEFNYLAMSVVGHEIDTIFAMHWAGSPLARHCPLASRFDFGLAERFIENGLPRKHSGVPRFKGTPKYASLAAHTRITTTSKDDIEAWCYSLIELLPGLFRGTSTPWKKERFTQ